MKSLTKHTAFHLAGVFLIVVNIFGCCHGYPLGAPDGACDAMKPQHGGQDQTSAAPYSLTFSKTGTTYSAGEQITVTLQSTGANAFRGYLIQARKSSSSSDTVGAFTLGNDQANHCTGKEAVTHSSRADKMLVSVVWTAPSDYTGNVTFFYSIVGTAAPEYWVKLTSATFTYAASATTPTTTTTTTTTPTTTDTSFSLDPACSVSKSCIHDCSVTGTGCTYLVSWMDGGGDTVEFTLKRQVTGDAWTAVGFSATRLMVETSVVSCESNAGNVSVKSSYNDNAYSNDDLPVPSFGVTLTSSSHADGVLSCTFSRAKTAAIASSQTSRRKRAAADGTTFFDLNTDWFIILAYGRFYGQFRLKHDTSPVISLSLMDLQSLLTTAAPTTTTATPTGGTSGISLDPACSVSKSCLHDCSLTGTGCTYLVSWMDGGGDTVEFTLKRKVTGDAWTAVGFSASASMGDTSVQVCESVDGAVVVKSAYNNDQYSNADLQPSDFGVTLTSGSHANGVLSCTFSRAKTAAIASRKRAVTADGTTFFDLNTDWFIISAHGQIISKKSRTKHAEYPVLSPSPVDLQSVFTPVTTTPVTPVAGSLKKDNECGSSKGCLHDCDGSGECSFINTWMDDGGDDIEFTMRFKTGGQNMFSAMGLSTDNKMGDDRVIECVADGDTAQAKLSFNAAGVKSNSRLSEPTLGLVMKSSKHSDGVLECVFSRKKSFLLASSGSRRKRAATDASTYSDLNEDWFLLHAHGSSIAGFIRKHKDLPLVSDVKADFQSTQDIGVTLVSNYMVKTHGILMVLAWCFSASIGIVLARFYKPAWGESKLCGEKVWFQLHRTFMVLAFLLVAVSFILIFVEVDGYSQMSDSTIEKSHPIMGIVVMVLTLINPIMAMFRPHPDAPKRPLFNVAHLLVGMAVYLISMVNIFFGVSLKIANVSDRAKIVLYVWVAWQVVVNIILTIHDMCHKSPAPGESYQMHDISKEPEPQGKKNKSKGEPLKKMLFILHVIVIVALSIAVCVIIWQNKEG